MTTVSKTTLSAELGRLPEVHLAQGTFGHWGNRHRARRADREEWIAAFLVAGHRPRHVQVFSGYVRLYVEVHYPTAKVPDIDNILAGLKTAIDLLQPLRHASKGSHGGHFGWIANDRLIQSLTIERIAQADRAPFTWFFMEAVEVSAGSKPPPAMPRER